MSETQESTRHVSWRITYLASQVFVRILLALVTFTAFTASGAMASDGMVTKRGTAVATHCERVGPVSIYGLGWYWACEAAITWGDGSKSEAIFDNSELTPQNRTEPAPVAWRELDNRGHMVTVERPKPYADFGWALFIALLPATIFGIRIPGVPPMSPELREERRRRIRLQLWQPLMIPVSWGLVIAGGLATADPPIFPGLAAVTILLGYVALVVTWVVYLNQRRHGVAEPPVLSPERQVRCLRAAKWLTAMGGAGLLIGLVAGAGNGLGVFGTVAIPLAMTAFGWRLTLVTNRHSRQFDGTAQSSASS